MQIILDGGGRREVEFPQELRDSVSNALREGLKGDAIPSFLNPDDVVRFYCTAVCGLRGLKSRGTGNMFDLFDNRLVRGTVQPLLQAADEANHGGRLAVEVRGEYGGDVNAIKGRARSRLLKTLSSGMLGLELASPRGNGAEEKVEDQIEFVNSMAAFVREGVTINVTRKSGGALEDIWLYDDDTNRIIYSRKRSTPEPLHPGLAGSLK